MAPPRQSRVANIKVFALLPWPLPAGYDWQNSRVVISLPQEHVVEWSVSHGSKVVVAGPLGNDVPLQRRHYHASGAEFYLYAPLSQTDEYLSRIARWLWKTRVRTVKPR